MLVGVLGAIAQGDVKRVLSFQIVSHIGYMIMGLGLFSVAGLAAAVLYTVHHIVSKTALFLNRWPDRARRGVEPHVPPRRHGADGAGPRCAVPGAGVEPGRPPAAVGLRGPSSRWWTQPRPGPPTRSWRCRWW
jgi:hypothetical protein